jgi:hypothetical protein
MASGQLFDDEFKAAIRFAGAQARIETLQAGISVFYREPRRDLDIMECPSGRKFEIHFIENAPGDQNYEVVRELDETGA